MDVRPAEDSQLDRKARDLSVPANIFRRGDTWYARFFIGGRLRRISLRTSDLREARARLKGLRLKAERRLFGVEGAATWNEAVAAYGAGILDAGGVKDSTAKRYRVSLRQLRGAFEGKPLPAITTQAIASYVAERQASGTTNATIRRDLTTISRVLTLAASRGMVTRNVAQDFDRSLIRERRAPIKAPTDETVEEGAATAGAKARPELASLIRFLRATGMRAGEALRAKWEHFDGEALTIHETKAGRARTIQVPAEALPERRTGGRLFPGLPLTSGDLASDWQWVRRSLPEDRHFRLHDLRHAYAIAEIRAGRDIYDLSHHLGHSSVKVTEVYLGYAAGRRAKVRG
jgi:integrase/recombinase XerD